MKKTLTIILMLFASVGFLQAADLPMDFEAGPYTFVDFDGGATTVIANPQSSGINTSETVAQMVKSDGQVWGGSKIELTDAIDFATNQVFTMKVFSPRAGMPVLFKLENGDGSIATERSVNTTVANEWETLTYDFTGSTSGVYTYLVFIFDLGVVGDGSANFTFLFDDIDFIPSEDPPLVLPINFEEGPYGFIDFDGGTATVIANTQSSGINTSATVAQIVRDGGATWAGSKLVLAGKIDFSTTATFTMKVFSARADIPVLFKLEGEGVAPTELLVNTSKANEWETLSWDFTGKPSDTYNSLVFMFDFGTVGDGTAYSTFLFDDVELIDNTGGLSQIDLPVDFESTSVNYKLSDFGGTATALGADPLDAGNTVAITTKHTGSEAWAGTTIGTALGFATYIPFTETDTKISVKVYSPSSGIPVRLKVEDHDDPTLTAETEAFTMGVNTWEVLVFDFSSVAEGTNPFNPTTNFDKTSIFFNFGLNGSNGVYYWDDVIFGTGTSSVSQSNLSLKNIHVYAHEGILDVNSDDQVMDGIIEVFDIAGRKLFSSSITGSREQYTLNTQGVLIIKITDYESRQVYTEKLISH